MIRVKGKDEKLLVLFAAHYSSTGSKLEKALKIKKHLA